jgi:hypothetical protein
VLGPMGMPRVAWPVPMRRLGRARARPMMGRPSGLQGRRPRQISLWPAVDGAGGAADGRDAALIGSVANNHNRF